MILTLPPLEQALAVAGVTYILRVNSGHGIGTPKSKHAVYASHAQAVTNARRALAAAGYHAECLQARQIISWQQLTLGNATSLRAQKKRHARGTLHKTTQKQNTWWNGNLT